MSKTDFSTLPSLYREIAAPLKKTEERIMTMIRSENGDIEAAAKYLLNSGGKRLRPALLLMAGGCGDFEANEEKLIAIAAAIELVHTASLIHDDIVDATPLRRGKPTVAAAFGKITAVYTGNYLLCEAIRAIIANGDRHTEDVAVRTATEMCRGEFLQLRTEAAPDFDGGDYILRVRRKTANLMAAACDIGAHTAGAGEEVSAAMAAFGESLGIAFQITDDILDYVGDDAFGKAAGGDLREGLATMPLICAWESGGERKRMKELFFASRSSEQAVAELIDVVRANNGTKKAADIAAAYIAKAKESLTAVDNPALRRRFGEIADFIIERGY